MAGLDTAISVLKNIFAAANCIYKLHEQAKTNKKLSERLKKRIEGLLKPLKKLEKDPKKTRDMEGVLMAFETDLERAKKWMETYTTSSWWKKYFLALGSYRKFCHINDQLSETAETLQILLMVEDREKSEESIWEDMKADIQHLKSEMRLVGDQVDRGAQQTMEMLKDQNGQPWNIRVIQAIELEYGALVNTTDRYKMYKGKYNKNFVLIKVMLGELETDNEFVKRTFLKECEIMKKCESPNILQVFGICFEETSEGPRYSLVTEYCDQGTLRDMLQTVKNLNWGQKLMMALDATSALYSIHHKVVKATYHSGRNRIHQSEKKAFLHRSLSSRKYLVKGYSLKLSGFEFSKTESSMRRNPNEEPEELELPYKAPESLTSGEYDVHSEIFSLGVVIYEIVTGSLPLQGLSLSDFQGKTELVYPRLYAEVMAGLQISCPAVLRDIIRDCLQIDPQKRPNAGDIANRLVAEPEPQVPVMETMV
ncbi:mixed lineage kinase domain-like protein [Lithobates pipiens]